MSNSHKKFVENAAGAFVGFPIEVKRWDGVAKLKRAAEKAAKDAGADPASFRGYVNLLGSYHHKLKAVKALYMKLYTYLYENALPFERGVYLVPSVRFPQVLADVEKLKAAADEELENFITDYDRFRTIALSDDMGDWKSEVKDKYPSADEIRRKFGCEIKPPKPVAPIDLSRSGVSLPTDVAAAISDQAYDQVASLLEAAKDAALSNAREACQKVIDQVGADEKTNKDGSTYTPRVHPSVLSNAKRAAEMLRDMTQGYDNDPRLVKLADKIEKEVANVPASTDWKNSPMKRDESVKAAKVVENGLKAYQKSRAGGSAAAPNKSTAPKASKVRAGGIMGKKLAKGKAKA